VTGSGTINLSLSGTSNTVTASGGTLDITGALSTTPTLAIANVASSVLKIDNSANPTIKAVTVDTKQDPGDRQERDDQRTSDDNRRQVAG
jgi:hypothetical protein